MSTPVSASRPRTMAVAFWCWVVAAILTAAFGMYLMVLPGALQIGILVTIVGLVLAYLAGRAGKGDLRFARATVALAMATVVFLSLMLLFVLPPFLLFVLVIVAVMVLLITGSVFSQRPTSREWLESQGAA